MQKQEKHVNRVNYHMSSCQNPARGQKAVLVEGQTWEEVHVPDDTSGRHFGVEIESSSSTFELSRRQEFL